MTTEAKREAIALKPCPFCGADEHLSVVSVGVLTGDMPDRPHRVVCHNISHDTVSGPVDYGHYAAIKAWNTRTIMALAEPQVSDDTVRGAAELRQSASDLRANADGDCNAIMQAMHLESRATAMLTASPASEPQALSEERIEALAHRFYDAARPDCAVPYGIAERLAKIALATETQKGSGE